jgi:hypothetical protein
VKTFKQFYEGYQPLDDNEQEIYKDLAQKLHPTVVETFKQLGFSTPRIEYVQGASGQFAEYMYLPISHDQVIMVKAAAKNMDGDFEMWMVHESKRGTTGKSGPGNGFENRELRKASRKFLNELKSRVKDYAPGGKYETI